MTTLRFPSAVDSFDIHAPGEVIKAMHVNDVQSAIGAIEAFCFSLDQVIKGHISQTTAAHEASSISTEDFTLGTSLRLPSFVWSATNVQVAIEQLKAFSDAVAIQAAKLTELNDHINTSLSEAHAGRLDGYTRIDFNSVRLENLNFTPALLSELNTHINDNIDAHLASAIGVNPSIDGYNNTQNALAGIFTKLNTHKSTDINTAHDGYILGTKIKLGEISEAHLSFATATQAELDAHTTLSSGVHGVTGTVVGTTDTQTIENKRFISTEQGTKIALFTSTVEEIDKKLFIPGYSGANSAQAQSKQLIIRSPSSTTVTAAATNSTTVYVTTPSLFKAGDTVTFYYPASSYENSVSRIVADISSDHIVVSSLGGGSSSVTIPQNSAAVNSSIPNPLFEVTSDGYTTIQNLTIKNSTFQDITFSDNLVVDGTLHVNSSTTIDGVTTLKNTTTIQSTLAVQDNATISGSLTTGAITTSDINASGTLSVNSTSTLNGAVTTNNDLSVGGSFSVQGSGTFGTSVTADQFTATDGYYNSIHLPTFRADFLAHQTQAVDAHPSSTVSYSSFERIDSSLPTTYPGLVLQATIQADPNPSDGYVLVDRANVFKVGDTIGIGQDISGTPTFSTVTITNIQYSSYTPEYFQDLRLAGTPVSSIPYPKLYLSSVPSGLLVTNKARIIRKVTTIKEATDTLTVKLNDHTKSLVKAHQADAITTAPFNFLSIFYGPSTNNLGDITLQAVLDEFGKDLYHHLDGYDGVNYPHAARDIGFANSLSSIGRKVFLTQNANSGTNTLYLVDASSLAINDSIQVRSDQAPSEVHTIINKVGNIISVTPNLTSNFNTVDNAYILDFNLQTVQDAIEALASNYDLTNHVQDPVDAHNATAIKFDNSVLNLGTNVQAAIENLKTYTDGYYGTLNSNLTEHLNDTIDAHDASAISFSSTYNSNLSGSIDNVQTAIETWNPRGDIPEKVFSFLDGQATPANITGLVFDPTKVRSAIIHYSVYRYYSGTEVEMATVGTLRIVYKTRGNIWLLDNTYGGDSPGVSLTVTPSGQVQYTSSAIAGSPVANRLHFRAIVTTVNSIDGF